MEIDKNFIQIFVNEYISPTDTVLVISESFIQELKQMLNFINCEYFIINEVMLPGIDITFDKILPFMDNTFDCIICLKNVNNSELDRVSVINFKLFKN